MRILDKKSPQYILLRKLQSRIFMLENNQIIVFFQQCF